MEAWEREGKHVLKSIERLERMVEAATEKFIGAVRDIEKSGILPLQLEIERIKTKTAFDEEKFEEIEKRIEGLEKIKDSMNTLSKRVDEINLDAKVNHVGLKGKVVFIYSVVILAINIIFGVLIKKSLGG